MIGKLVTASIILGMVCVLTGNAQSPAPSAAKKPNILVIWGDDIGWQNVSAYGMGTMGYTTPNIDLREAGGRRLQAKLKI